MSSDGASEQRAYRNDLNRLVETTHVGTGGHEIVEQFGWEAGAANRGMPTRYAHTDQVAPLTFTWDPQTGRLRQSSDGIEAEILDVSLGQIGSTYKVNGNTVARATQTVDVAGRLLGLTIDGAGMDPYELPFHASYGQGQHTFTNHLTGAMSQTNRTDLGYEISHKSALGDQLDWTIRQGAPGGSAASRQLKVNGTQLAASSLARDASGLPSSGSRTFGSETIHLSYSPGRYSRSIGASTVRNGQSDDAPTAASTFMGPKPTYCATEAPSPHLGESPCTLHKAGLAIRSDWRQFCEQRLASCGSAAGCPWDESGGARAAARNNQVLNNLRQIGLAIINHESAQGHFPGHAVWEKLPEGQQNNEEAEEQREKLASWRLQVLPYMEGNDLRSVFDFSKPWDHDLNQSFLDPATEEDGRMPFELYSNVNFSKAINEAGRTGFVVPVGERTMFKEKDDRLSIGIGVGEASFGGDTQIGDIQDGTSMTIMAMALDTTAFPEGELPAWTEPRDWRFTFANLKRLGKCKIPAVFADGHVEVLDKSISKNILRNLICRNDENPIPHY